jgi:hypothetical protein
LITGIDDDADVRAGLFPPPGSIKRKGGLPKKHFQWLLAQICFEEHPQYSEAFKKAITPAQQKLWWGKIKNKVKVYVFSA